MFLMFVNLFRHTVSVPFVVCNVAFWCPSTIHSSVILYFFWPILVRSVLTICMFTPLCTSQFTESDEFKLKNRLFIRSACLRTPSPRHSIVA